MAVTPRQPALGAVASPLSVRPHGTVPGKLLSTLGPVMDSDMASATVKTSYRALPPPPPVKEITCTREQQLLGEKLDFKISTGLKDIIGKELITEAHTAIFELVKNAYDADATLVKIVFQNIGGSDGKNPARVLIVDNGKGMSYNDIKNKWLFVGYSAKKDGIPESGDFRDKISNRRRIFAGAKGIGRFSVDRLGQKTNLYTRKPSEPKVHRVQMDWRRFEDNQNELFQSIDVEYDTLDRFPRLDAKQGKMQHGTILEIFPLADTWNRANLTKLKKYLLRLINPAQTQNSGDFEIWIAADEFLEEDKTLEARGKKSQTINGRIDNVVFERMGIKTTQIRCSITRSKITTEITDKGRFVFRTEEANQYNGLHGIDIRISYLNRAAKKTFTDTMGIRPIQFGSIFLYKNGFRIHPYGEERDDWLNLEQRRGQGWARYLSAREVIGRVEINGTQPKFREVSSRGGGVVATEEFHMLLDVVKDRAIRWLERYVVEGLDWDNPKKDGYKKPDADIKTDSLELVLKFTGQIKDPNKRVEFNPNLMEIVEEKQSDDLSEVVKNIEALALFAESSDEKARIKKYARQIRSATMAYAEKRAKQAAESVKKEILLMKESQSAGIKMAEDYNHWIGIATGNITTYLMRLVDEIREKGGSESVLSIVEQISRENQKIAAVSSIVGRANFNVQAEKQTADIVAYITQYITGVIADREKRIRFNFANEGIEFITKFTPLEIAIMLDNFVVNSRKTDAGRVTLKFSTSDNMLRVLISDDGAGISDETAPHVFKRGFSTTSGSGIGLSHIRSIAREMGGDVKFLGNGANGMGSGACFEVVIGARS